MKQIRNTVQKKTILEVVGNMKNHPSAAMVYEEVQKVLPKVSRATVYRVLQDAADNGEILNNILPDYPKLTEEELPLLLSELVLPE